MSSACHYGPATPAGEVCQSAPALSRSRGDKTQICFPIFCFAKPKWIGSSYIVYEFPLVMTAEYISFASLRKYLTTDYVLAVRTRDQRYKFWQEVGEEFQAPLYNGQPIFNEAVFEIWTTKTSPSFTSPDFCVPVQVISPCPPTDPNPIITPRARLWAKFCTVPHPPYNPTVHDAFHYVRKPKRVSTKKKKAVGKADGENSISFYFEKPCD